VKNPNAGCALLGVAILKLKMTGTIKQKVFGYPFAPVLFLLCAMAFTVVQV
jgi:hypothetical protein